MLLLGEICKSYFPELSRSCSTQLPFTFEDKQPPAMTSAETKKLLHAYYQLRPYVKAAEQVNRCDGLSWFEAKRVMNQNIASLEKKLSACRSHVSSVGKENTQGTDDTCQVFKNADTRKLSPLSPANH